jgi:mannose/fructose/N-acetylgalactosamine-specific phosphotransferase system component IIC
MSDPTVIWLALLAALLSLDSNAVGQFMVSQPLVGGWLMGVAAGSPAEGLFAGTVLQLLCMTELRVGASIPPDGSLAGLAGVALCLLRPGGEALSGTAVLGVAVLLFFPVALAGRQAEIIALRANRRWTPLAASLFEEGRPEAAQLAMAGGLLFFFIKSLVVVMAYLVLVGAFLQAAGGFVSRFAFALELLARVAPFAGLGVVAARQRPGRATALAGLAAGVLAGWGLV